MRYEYNIINIFVDWIQFSYDLIRFDFIWNCCRRILSSTTIYCQKSWHTTDMTWVVIQTPSHRPKQTYRPLQKHISLYLMQYHLYKYLLLIIYRNISISLIVYLYVYACVCYHISKYKTNKKRNNPYLCRDSSNKPFALNGLACVEHAIRSIPSWYVLFCSVPFRSVPLRFASFQSDQIHRNPFQSKTIQSDTIECNPEINHSFIIRYFWFIELSIYCCIN